VTRAHLGEFGLVVPKGVQNIERLVTLAEATGLPANALNSVRLLAEQFRDTKVKIEDVTAEISRTSETGAVARRLKTIPGIGPITSSVLAATLPDASGFKTARDLAASC
jgi:transposase